MKHILLICILAISVSQVLSRAFPAANLPSRDGGVYAYIGSEIVRGKLPYVDAWESKPPGIFYLNALGISLGGRWGIWVIEYLCLLLAAWMSHKVITMWWGDFPALVGTLAWLSGLLFIPLDGNYTEEYSLPLSFLAFVIFSSSLQRGNKWFHDFSIGLTAGLSFLLRPNNIGVQFAMGLTVLLFGLQQREYHRTFARLSLIGLGAALPFIFTVYYFASQQALKPMLDAAFIYNFFYTGGHASLTTSLARGFLILNIIMLMALMGYVPLLVKHRENTASDALRQWRFLLLIGLPIEIYLSSLSGRPYNHYFICWLPVLGLLCASAFQLYGKRIMDVLSSQPKEFTYAFLAIVLIVGSMSGLKMYADTAVAWISGTQMNGRIDPVSDYVREHTKPDDKVLVWGAQAGINFLSGRVAPSPYFLYPLFIPSPVTIPMADQFLADLTENPPVLIVDAYFFATGNEIFYSLDPAIRARQRMHIQPDSLVFSAHNLEDVFDFISQNYHRETIIDGTQIYRRNP